MRDFKQSTGLYIVKEHSHGSCAGCLCAHGLCSEGKAAIHTTLHCFSYTEVKGHLSSLVAHVLLFFLQLIHVVLFIFVICLISVVLCICIATKNGISIFYVFFLNILSCLPCLLSFHLNIIVSEGRSSVIHAFLKKERLILAEKAKIKT